MSADGFVTGMLIGCLVEATLWQLWRWSARRACVRCPECFRSLL